MMLAESSNDLQSGRLDRDIHLPSTAKRELTSFIFRELDVWRDHRDRPAALAETDLTEYLCDHLNSAAYHSAEWSHVQFRTETGDEARGGRKIDLTVKPRGVALVVEGRRHTQFEALFPLECKRLPTPKGNDRDEREYVVTEPGTTGGIQRFKFGHHGSTHTFAVMIGYVQAESFAHWLNQLNEWIRDLSKREGTLWSDADLLQMRHECSFAGVCTLASYHQRAGGLPPCELRHLWVRMDWSILDTVKSKLSGEVM
jgi:hypothetical protein